MDLSEEEWKKRLSDEEYRILREKGTEKAFTGAYHACKDKGTYVCAGCGKPLFSSDDKFDSGTGWPSFDRPYKQTAVGYETDRSLFSERIEVHCSDCGGHLGHVFEDGPTNTHKRYCINSISLKLKEQ